MTTTPHVAVHLVAHGRVQGVSFRAHVAAAARGAGAAGWAENRPDGTVEVRAEGSPDAVAAVEHATSRGPAHARVERVERRPVPAEGLRGFDTR